MSEDGMRAMSAGAANCAVSAARDLRWLEWGEAALTAVAVSQ